MPVDAPQVALPGRFWEKVNKEGPESVAGLGRCWLWTGATTFGYGRFNVSRKSALAHRLSYCEANGPVPDGLTLDHLCRTRNCVNPTHLEPVTNAENTARGASGWRQRERVACPSGHAYDEGNTRWYDGRRYCRECHLNYSRAYKARLRAIGGKL